jgi:hypothetical protein
MEKFHAVSCEQIQEISRSRVNSLRRPECGDRPLGPEWQTLIHGVRADKDTCGDRSRFQDPEANLKVVGPAVIKSNRCAKARKSVRQIAKRNKFDLATEPGDEIQEGLPPHDHSGWGIREPKSIFGQHAVEGQDQGTTGAR